MNDVPTGFQPLFRSSPFLDLIGPFFHKRDGDSLVIGLRIETKHTNSRGLAHGGVLLTMADIALGYCTAFSVEPPASLATASLSADFAGPAQVGDWVTAHVDIQKLGSQLAFASAYLCVNGARIVRTSGVFARGGRE
jgi:acyl-coenzyme A thioesterase 13